jgi:hypothetical protein
MIVKNLNTKPAGNQYIVSMDIELEEGMTVSFSLPVANNETDSILELQSLAMSKIGNALLLACPSSRNK